jgi:hypothetical protein
LQHGFALRLVELRECLLNQRSVFEAAFMQQFSQPERRVAQQNLGVLQLAVVSGKSHVNAVSEFLGALQQAGGTVHVSGRDLAGAEFDHLVHKLRIKEALFLGLGSAGALFQSIKGLLIDDLIIE